MQIQALRFIFQFSAFLMLIVLSAYPSAAQTSVDINRKFTPEQLIEDVNFYVKTLEEAHANPYVYISRKDWHARADEVKSRIAKQGAMTQYEFWRLFTPLVSALQDKHTSVVDPRFFIPNNPTKYLPVHTIYVDGKILVTDAVAAGAEIPKGAIITSVNGIKSDELIRKVSEYRFGVERERLTDAGEWLWIGAAEVFGKPDKFNLTFSGGAKVEVKGLTITEKVQREKAARANQPKPSDAPLELKFLEGGSVAYLNAWTFSYDLEKYKALLAEIFAQIKSSGAKTLIVDLKDNTGGSSALGDALLDMFNDKPYKHFSSRWKKSLQYIERMKSQNAPIPDYYLNLKPGEIYASSPRIVKPGENPLRFKGKVYVLSGRNTFSSGQMFLALVKDNKLATIIGEETNEPACYAGELYPFNLPNSRLRVTLSVRYWMSPGGCRGGRGIVPEVPVKQRAEDYLAGRDAILKAALDLIKRKR
jgi:hypothetical protein